MTRQSLRIKQKAAADNAQMSDAIASINETIDTGRKRARDDDYQEEEDDPDARKRPRKSNASNNDEVAETSTKKTKQRMPEEFRKVRGKLGILERLAKDVPLDIIFEILCHLDPSDLLRLARTSKDLRGILMSKSSESIWRAARENVEGLPPLPVDLNEPQYAHLLYESYCHVCNHKGRCDIVMWSFRMRCCRSCATKTFPAFYGVQLRSLLPAEFQGKESQILPQERIQRSSRRQRRDVGNFQIAARLKAEFEALQTEEDRTVWITRKIQERQVIDAHGRQCELWHQARLEKRTGELTGIRIQRKNAILERLGEIGWREEAEKIIQRGTAWRGDEFTNHKAVKQSKKLTDYGWNSIKNELVEMLNTHKTNRLAGERHRLFANRYARLAHEYAEMLSTSDLREPFPPAGNILTNKIFEDLMWDTPEDQELTQVFFRGKLLEHLPGIVEAWRTVEVQKIVEIMQKSNPTASIADLHLATSVFECSCCPGRTRMHYPQMFYHACCHRNSPGDSVSAERLKTYSGIFGQWGSNYISFSDSGSRIARTIVESCSLDPATATIQDLSSANPLIECTTCYRPPDGRYYAVGRIFMRWPLALADHRDHTLIINSFGEEIQEILAREPERSIHSPAHEICCAHCHKSVVRSFRSIVDHCRAHHDSVDVEELPASSIHKPEAIPEHWYWNPRLSLRAMGEEFRYRPPIPVVASTSTDSSVTSTDTAATATTSAAQS